MKKIIGVVALLLGVALFFFDSRNEPVEVTKKDVLSKHGLTEEIKSIASEIVVTDKNLKLTSAVKNGPVAVLDKDALRYLDSAKRMTDRVLLLDRNLFSILKNLNETHDVTRTKEHKRTYSETYSAKDGESTIYLLFNNKDKEKMRNFSYRNKEANMGYMASSNVLVNNKDKKTLDRQRSVTLYSLDREDREFGERSTEVSYQISDDKVTDVVFFDLGNDLVYVYNLTSDDIKLHVLQGDKEVIYNYDSSGNLQK